MALFDQIARVAKVIELKHILRAVIFPPHALRAFKYHFRRVSEIEFVRYLSNKWNCSSEDVYAAYQDYENNISLWEKISENLGSYPGGYGLQMTKELPSIYLLIRLVKPNCIVETGVASGASSAYILRALQDNRNGQLFSVDLPPDNFPKGKTSGWIVSENLRNRWKLNIGNSKALLEPLLNDIGKIDCFIHDSLHTYEHMMWEFRTAWKHLRPGGLFLSHDVGANEAFFDFMKEKNIGWKYYRVFHVLGGFQKPPVS